MIDTGVDIWIAHLDEVAGEMESFRALLDGAETERVARLRSDQARRRFTARHAIRRLLLAGYLAQRPEQIAFPSVEGQKPRLQGLNPDGLQFNESTSDELAVLAVAHGVELGIDVERIRPLSDARAIVARFGSASEVASYQRVPEHARGVAFLRWWTAKEAFVKMIGRGLEYPLDAFSVGFPLVDDAPTPPSPPSGGGDDEGSFSLTDLTPAAGYVGTLVVTGRPARIRQRRWTPGGRIDTRGAA